MRAILRTVAGDFRGRKLQTALLFLVVAVAAAGITGGLAQQRTVAERWDAAFADANGAHVLVIGQPAALRRIASEPAVAASAGPFRSVWGTLGFGGRTVEELEMRAAGPARARVGTPLLYDGRWLAAGRDGEVVVERDVAIDAGLTVGDRVNLAAEDRKPAAFRVVGIALDLTDCFYPSCESATAWASDEALRGLDAKAESSGSTLLVRLRDPAAVGTFASGIQARYGKRVTDIEDWENTRSDTLGLNLFFAAFLASFGVVLLLAAGLVVLSSVSGQVLARYRELGMLKAIGFTPRSLVGLVLGENLAVATVGALAGFAAGSVVAPQLELTVGEVLGGGGATFFVGIGLVALVLVLAMVAAATILPAWRAGRVPASLAIARGAAAVSTRPSRVARVAARLRLGTPIVVGLKDSAARPLRATMTVLALAVTVVALVATLGFQRTGDSIAADPALIGSPYDLAVEPDEASRAEIERALSANRAVAAWYTATERRAAVGDFSFQIRVLGGAVADAGYVVREGRMLRSADETVVGYGLLERLDLAVGDTVSLDVAGGRLDLEVVGWYAEAEDTGLIAQITLDALRRVEPGADAGEYLVRLDDDTEAPSVRDAVLRATGGRAGVGLVDRSTDELDAFGVALIGITLLVLAVGLTNLVATTTLGVRERMRDIGVLKTIGFTPLQVAVSVAVGSAAYGAAAVLLGLPAGLVTASAMLDGVGTESGIGPGIAQLPTVGPLAFVALGIVGAAGVLGLVVAGRAASARVADVLRAE